MPIQLPCLLQSSIATNCSAVSPITARHTQAAIREPDIKGRIIGVQTQMNTFDLLFGLQLSMKILKITDKLSRTLQKQSMSAAEGQSVAELTFKTRPCALMKTSMLSLVCVTVSMNTPTPTFQCCHGKEKYLGD